MEGMAEDLLGMGVLAGWLCPIYTGPRMRGKRRQSPGSTHSLKEPILEFPNSEPA